MTGKTASALLFVSLAWAQAPDHLKLGKAAESSGNWKAAEEGYRLALREQPDSAAAATAHARVLVQLGQAFDAVLELGPFVDRHPASTEVIAYYVELLESVTHDEPLAEKALLRASETAPRDAQIWSLLGRIYLTKPDPARAAAAYETARKLLPRDPVVLGGLAYAHAQAGQTVTADAEFKTALAGADQNGPLLALYASYLQESGRTEDCIAYFTRALHTGFSDWQLYSRRSKAYFTLEKYPKALADALEALRLGGERRETRLTLMKIYQKMNQPAKVEEQLQIISVMDAKEADLWTKNRKLRETLNGAESAIAKGDCTTAISNYEQLVKDMPSFYESWFPLGVCYSKLGRTGDAENALHHYLDAQPLSSDGHFALGLLYLSVGRFADAESELRTALRIDPADGEARGALQTACKQTGGCPSER